MGQENTTLKSNNSVEFTINNYVKIAQKHHQKVFESKKKSKK
jgi:putative salt-induced outer membrane protein YdiY